MRKSNVDNNVGMYVLLSFLNRDGEINGVHYHFVALNDMEAAIERGEFVEYAKVHTNMYGTSVKAVGDVSSFQTFLPI